MKKFWIVLVVISVLLSGCIPEEEHKADGSCLVEHLRLEKEHECNLKCLARHPLWEEEIAFHFPRD